MLNFSLITFFGWRNIFLCLLLLFINKGKYISCFLNLSWKSNYTPKLYGQSLTLLILFKVKLETLETSLMMEVVLYSLSDIAMLNCYLIFFFSHLFFSPIYLHFLLFRHYMITFHSIKFSAITYFTLSLPLSCHISSTAKPIAVFSPLQNSWPPPYNSLSQETSLHLHLYIHSPKQTKVSPFSPWIYLIQAASIHRKPRTTVLHRRCFQPPKLRQRPSSFLHPFFRIKSYILLE